MTRQPAPPKRRRPGWTGRVVVAAAVVAVALGAPAPGLAPLGAGCASASDGMQRVAVAVDFGTVPGSPGGAATMCVTVPAGATGADVLVERARQLGRPAPRYAPSGLLCAIDGFPASGCGERVDGAYRYWAYFLSDGGSWTYASTGPALRRATEARTEGWHYVAGAGTPVDPPPGLPASAQATCPPAPPVATTAAPAPAPPPAPTGPAAATEPAPAGATPAPAGGTVPPGPAGTGPDPAAASGPAGGQDPGPDPAAAGASGAAAPVTAPPGGGGPQAALAGAPGAADPDGAGPWALVAAVAAMVALAGGAVVTARRRRVDP